MKLNNLWTGWKSSILAVISFLVVVLPALEAWVKTHDTITPSGVVGLLFTIYTAFSDR